MAAYKNNCTFIFVGYHLKDSNLKSAYFWQLEFIHSSTSVKDLQEVNWGLGGPHGKLIFFLFGQFQ